MTQLTQLRRLRLAVRVIALYWLLVLAGLAVLTFDRLGDPRADLPSLWVGAIAGTVLGQVLALRNFRPWLATLLIGLAAYFLVPLVAAGFGPSLWKVFIPAALCGLWSLGDRTALVAFWFPAMVWMLSILDRATGALTLDASGAGLFGALAIGGVLFLRARETRRVELWRKVSVMPLAKTSAPSVLKARPGHGVARTGWTLTVTALTAAVTAWIAPRLWQLEPLAGDEVAIAERAAGGDADGFDANRFELPCCPVAHAREVPRSRIKEYLDIGRGHDDEPGPFEDARATTCRACEDVIAAPAVATVERAPVATSEPAVATPAPPIAGSPPRVDVETVAAPAPAAPQPTPAPTPAPTTQPTPAPTPAPVARPAPPPRVPHVATPHHARATPPRHGITWWPWLVALVSGALIFQLVALGLRPLRRLLILRHLRRPFWDETVDQRVSNAWQLALIGLCDAGWRPNTAEAPRELAARAGVDGVEACAVILERARHGLGVDAADLAEIQRQADVAYASARAKITRLPRALGWLRWPLT